MKLSEIADIILGQSPNSDTYNLEKNGIPFFQGNADFGLMFPTERVYCSKPIKIVQAGDVLLSVRAPIGAVNIANQKCCIGRGLAAIRPKKNISCTKYLYYLLIGRSVKLSDYGTGSTFKAINGKTLSALEIPAYDITQQKIIVAKLQYVDDLLTNRRTQLEKLDLFIKAKFYEMFGNGEYPIKKWSDIFYTATGKLDSNAMVEGGKYPFFTCSKEPLRIDTYAYDQEALLLAGNNAAGKYDVKYYNGKFNAYQRTYILTIKNGWSYQLFKFQLEDKLLFLQSQSLGGLTKYLTLGILNDLEFIVPPIELQNEFAHFVEQTENIKSKIKQSLEKLEILKQSLLQKYFG